MVSGGFDASHTWISQQFLKPHYQRKNTLHLFTPFGHQHLSTPHFVTFKVSCTHAIISFIQWRHHRIAELTSVFVLGAVASDIVDHPLLLPIHNPACLFLRLSAGSSYGQQAGHFIVLDGSPHCTEDWVTTTTPVNCLPLYFQGSNWASTPEPQRSAYHLWFGSARLPMDHRLWHLCPATALSCADGMKDKHTRFLSTQVVGKAVSVAIVTAHSDTVR